MSNIGIKKVVFSFAVSLVVFAIIFVAKAIITEKKVENGIYAIVTVLAFNVPLTQVIVITSLTASVPL